MRALRCELTYYGRQYTGTLNSQNYNTGFVTSTWDMMNGDWFDLEVYNIMINCKTVWDNTQGKMVLKSGVSQGLDFFGRCKYRSSDTASSIPSTLLCWRIKCVLGPSGRPALQISMSPDSPDSSLASNYMSIKSVTPDYVDRRINYLQTTSLEGYNYMRTFSNNDDVLTYQRMANVGNTKRPPVWSVLNTPSFISRAHGVLTSNRYSSQSNLDILPTSTYPSSHTNTWLYFKNMGYNQSHNNQYLIHIMELIKNANTFNFDPSNPNPPTFIGGLPPSTWTSQYGITRAGIGTIRTSTNNGTIWSSDPGFDYIEDASTPYNGILSINAGYDFTYYSTPNISNRIQWGQDVPGWWRPTTGTSYTQSFYMSNAASSYAVYTPFNFYNFYGNIHTNQTPYEYWSGMYTNIFRVYNSNLSNARSHQSVASGIDQPNLNSMPYVGILPVSRIDDISTIVKNRFTGFTNINSDVEKPLWSNNCGSRANSPYYGITIVEQRKDGNGNYYTADMDWEHTEPFGSIGTIGIRVTEVNFTDDINNGVAVYNPTIDCFIVPSFYSEWPALDIYGRENQNSHRFPFRWQQVTGVGNNTATSGVYNPAITNGNSTYVLITDTARL